MEFEQRMLKLEDGKRMPIRLEQSSWQAVDWLAGRAFLPWDDWCRKAIDAEVGGNATSSIRGAVIDALLTETVLQERVEATGQLQAIGFSLAGVCWCQKDIEHALSQAIVEGRQDLGSVEVISGIDEFGRVAIYIRNKLEDCPSMTISVPMKPEEWASRLDESQ